MELISVVISGGAGARLWPVSRKAFPKPFMSIGGSTLLSQAINRGQACGSKSLVVVTGEDHLFLTRDVIAEFASPPSTTYILEPKGRNTAPAIALAALACKKAYGLDAVMLILPADHLIPDHEAFKMCAENAVRQALLGQLVVFGILPTSPETGYGYIKVANASRNSQVALAFVEKPSTEIAIQYLASGKYYWNSGMFCFTVRTILDALQLHSPNVMTGAFAAIAGAKIDDDVFRFNDALFDAQPDISIDYAVMEHAKNVTVIPATFGWSDVGSWPSVAQTYAADVDGNTTNGNAIFIDTKSSHLTIEGQGNKLVATIGLREVVIVDTPDALLVMDKNAAQKVKSLVDMLKQQQHPSVFLQSIVHRPWGTYISLREELPTMCEGYKVKRITVKAGQSISLQFHRRRSEHWVVVQGKAMVQIGDTMHETLPGQYRFIPSKVNHRLTNIGTEELILIEIQFGEYLGEDDIVRLEDDYGRAS